jgi:tetratricopeptide (TPR) repeat protein
MGVGAIDAARELELGGAAMATFDLDGAVAHLSAAVRGFTAAGDVRQAAMASVHLGDVFSSGMGNLTAGRAWFARATRLVADEPPCIEQGWVAVAAMGCDVDDPADLLEKAELALDRARRFADLNLELKALADGGLAHVQAGRVDGGMAMLDEAMALACGAADDERVAGKAVCSFFTACCSAADFGRASSWAASLRRRGLIGGAPGTPAWLSSHCDSVQATSLVELGRWSQAEALLVQAVADFEERMPMPAYHPAIALADLRIHQGRLADAEQLLLGKDGHLQATLPAARLHLARGDHELARAVARRGLRAMADDRLRAADLLTVLAFASLELGDLTAASEAADALEQRVQGLNRAMPQARAAAVRARVFAASEALPDAIATVEGALDRLDVEAAPWVRARLLVELARLRDRSGDHAGAVADARVAAAAMAELDVVVAPEERAVLRALGAEPESERERGAVATATLRRDGKWWRAACDGASVRLADTKGLRHLAALVERPGIERHVLDLVDCVEGVAVDGIDRRRLGDAGPVADAQARSRYRHEVERLRSEIDEALAAGHDDRAQRLQGELDAIVAHLAAAFGLGGRDRRASSAAERARLNVTRAVRSAAAALTEALPEAGAALDRSIRTGLYCRYDPDQQIRWIVQS